MIQKEILTAPKVNESILYGVGYKPFTVGALFFRIMSIKHGFTVGGYSHLYSRWKGIRQRCNNPHTLRYKYYGGRGIKVCKEWDDYAKFHEWSMAHGYRDDLVIDRINNDGDYEPNNCRWVTIAINNKNKTSKRLGDWGIYPKKKGFYAQIQDGGVNYYGGFSEDINEVRRLRDELWAKIESKYQFEINETNLTDKSKRKKKKQDEKTGRFIWV